MNKVVFTIGIIIAVIGLIYTALPHSIHNSISNMFSMNTEAMPGMDVSVMQSHGSHQATGLIILVMGLGVLFAGWKILD